MRRDECADAWQIGGAGDNGADVLATEALGRTWVIQAKHRKDSDRRRRRLLRRPRPPSRRP